MNQQERTEQSIKIISTSALWYAWGQIDPGPTDNNRVMTALATYGFGTEHGEEFSKLYTVLAHEYAAETRSSRPNIIDAWKRFVHLKIDRGLDAMLDPEDLVGH